MKAQIDEAMVPTGGINPANCYSFDIYLCKAPTFKAKLIDINGWQGYIWEADSQLNPLLFKWYELNAMETEADDIPVEFRVTKSYNGMFVNDEVANELNVEESKENIKEF